MRNKFQAVYVMIVVVAFLTGCASRPVLQNTDSLASVIGDPVDHENRPTLKLEAYPQVGFSPLRVNVRAVLENVPTNDPIFGCLWQSWSFGDGSISSEKPSCDRPDYSVQSDYIGEHVYVAEGVYQVRFVLGDNQLQSNPVLIRVVGRN